MDLVPNRECGECNVCCKALLIDDPELQKLPGVLCANWKTGTGCGVYDKRPEACRGFFCGWRYMGELGDELRPDRSGIMIRFTSEQIPPGLAPVGLFFLIHGSADVIGPGLAGYFNKLVAERIAVFLAIRGPEGYSDGAVLLNGHLAAAGGDANKALAVMRDALAALSTNKFERAVFRNAMPRIYR